MARITEQQAALLGIPARSSGLVARQPAGLVAGGRLKTRAASPVKRPHPKNGRQPRDPGKTGRDEVLIAIVTDPRPKARARTSLSRTEIQKCFMQSHGNLGVFTSLLEKLKHHTYTPDSTVAFEKEVAWSAARAMAKHRLEPFATPVQMTLIFILQGDPQTWPTDQSDGDLDNLEKAVKDALNGIAYVDDRLVVRVLKEKRCGPEAQIEIRLCHP